MKKGDRIEGLTVKYDFPNVGTVEVIEDGEKQYVKVKNAIIGQRVSGVINKKKHGLLEARLEEVIERAPLETAEPCPHFKECGGCTYQTFPYEEQLKIKEKQILDLLKKALGDNGSDIDDSYEGIIASPDKSEYRNKMEFSFGDEYKDGPLALGMHKRGSTYDVVNTFECRIVDEDYRQILKKTHEYFSKLNLPYFHKMRHEGILRHLCVRKGRKSGEILVFLVTSSQWKDRFSEEEWNKVLDEWKDILLGIELKGSFAGILHVTNDSLADAVIDQGSKVLYGKDYFEEELLGLKFKISPFSFFQNNSLAAELLYSKVKEYLLENMEGKPVVYDLYTGTGTIAQLVSEATQKTIGVEIVEEAVEAAKQSAKRNGVENCEFIAGDVLKCLDDIETLPDYIILDPPRDGINPKALDKILNYGVKDIVYVSCKPSSLARDLSVFYEHGYRVKKCCLTDLFPSTVHVETVVLLSKKQSQEKEIQRIQNVRSDDDANVKEQYATSKGLDIRITFHNRYSTNKQGYSSWMVSNYDIHKGMTVLELGCGSGTIWRGHDDLIADCSKLVLSDLSEGMLETARGNIGEKGNVEYRIEDIRNLSFDDNSFDVVIANAMLYHVPDLNKGLQEVRRVLKSGGAFYCATFGENNFTDKLAEWFRLDGEEFNPNHNFTMQNGADKLCTVFDDVIPMFYEDSLHITEMEDLVEYIQSLASLKAVSNLPKQKIRDILTEHASDGVIDLPKDYGMFKCR